MASLKSIFDLSGSMGNVSFYKRKDMPDETLARTKGGPSRRKVLTDPRMENTRRSAREFGGVGTTTKHLRAGLQPLLPVSDLLLVSELNKLLHPIKDMDTTSPWGQRAVCISRAPWLLEGFQLNGQFALETIIHGQLALAVSDTGIALTVPALLPGANLTLPPGSFTSYRLVLNAAWVPDMVYTKNGFQPATALLPAPQYVCSPWQLTKAPADSCTLQLPPDILSGNPAAIASGTLMISVAILLGRPAKDGRIEPVKHMGAGKVLAMYAGGLAGKYDRFPAAIPQVPIQPAGDDTPSLAAYHYAGGATASEHTACSHAANQSAASCSYAIYHNADVLPQDHAHGIMQANTGVCRLAGMATSRAYLEWQQNASYSYYRQAPGVHYAYSRQGWHKAIDASEMVQTGDNCPTDSGLVSNDSNDPGQWPAGNTLPLPTAVNTITCELACDGMDDAHFETLPDVAGTDYNAGPTTKGHNAVDLYDAAGVAAGGSRKMVDRHACQLHLTCYDRDYTPIGMGNRLGFINNSGLTAGSNKVLRLICHTYAIPKLLAKPPD